jgi:hypothetical protein
VADDFLSLSFVYGLSANQQAVCCFEYLCDSCNLIYNVSWQWTDLQKGVVATKIGVFAQLFKSAWFQIRVVL